MNAKQALLTMAEYIQATYPLMQKERLRYDEQAIFLAANREVSKRKRLDEKDARNRLDYSLSSVTQLKKTKTVCQCRRCEGQFYMVTWKGRDETKWPIKEGSCIYCVTLQQARIYMQTNREIDPYLIEKLKGKTRCKPVSFTEPLSE